MNHAAAWYLQALYERGQSLFLGRYTILALQSAFPALKGHLQRPWSLLRAWQRRRATQTRGGNPFRSVRRSTCAPNDACINTLLACVDRRARPTTH